MAGICGTMNPPTACHKQQSEMIVIGVIAGWPRQTIAVDRRRLCARRCRKAERVLTEPSQLRDVRGCGWCGRCRPNEPQTQRQERKREA